MRKRTTDWERVRGRRADCALAGVAVRLRKMNIQSRHAIALVMIARANKAFQNSRAGGRNIAASTRLMAAIPKFMKKRAPASFQPLQPERIPAAPIAAEINRLLSASHPRLGCVGPNLT